MPESNSAVVLLVSVKNWLTCDRWAYYFFVRKNNEAQRSQSEPNFTLTNNTAAEFDSGISYQGIEGRNTVYSVLCDILGAQNIAGEHSLKIPYSTIAVKLV